MAHSICITYNYCREDNTGWWVTVEDRGTEWTFDYREGSRSGFTPSRKARAGAA